MRIGSGITRTISTFAGQRCDRRRVARDPSRPQVPPVRCRPPGSRSCTDDQPAYWIEITFPPARIVELKVMGWTPSRAVAASRRGRLRCGRRRRAPRWSGSRHPRAPPRSTPRTNADSCSTGSAHPSHQPAAEARERVAAGLAPRGGRQLREEPNPAPHLGVAKVFEESRPLLRVGLRTLGAASPCSGQADGDVGGVVRMS